MDCYSDNQPTPAQRRVHQRQKGAFDKRASAWLVFLLLAVIGLVWLASKK